MDGAFEILGDGFGISQRPVHDVQYLITRAYVYDKLLSRWPPPQKNGWTTQKM